MPNRKIIKLRPDDPDRLSRKPTGVSARLKRLATLDPVLVEWLTTIDSNWKMNPDQEKIDKLQESLAGLRTSMWLYASARTVKDRDSFFRKLLRIIDVFRVHLVDTTGIDPGAVTTVEVVRFLATDPRAFRPC